MESLYTNRMARPTRRRSNLRAKHAPTAPDSKRIIKRGVLCDNLNRTVYFHKAWGRPNSGYGIAKETQAFRVVEVLILRDGSVGYKLRLEDEGADSMGYVVAASEVTVCEVVYA